MVVNNKADVEVEVFGVTYERYALAQLFSRLTRKLNLRTVIELPASGAKAMPSLYSLGFALAGCRVTLVNADLDAILLWEQLGLSDRLETISDEEVTRLCAGGRRWDLCWNFAVLPTSVDPAGLLKRMAECSAKWLMLINVNKHNIGFWSHKLVHRAYKIPWTHGEVSFFSPFQVKPFLKNLGFQQICWGVVDCPLWPDSLGFRDLRLHRQGERELRWESPYVEYLQKGSFPAWVNWIYAWERLPVPAWVKLPYAHLYYMICRVDREKTF